MALTVLLTTFTFQLSSRVVYSIVSYFLCCLISAKLSAHIRASPPLGASPLEPRHGRPEQGRTAAAGLRPGILPPAPGQPGFAGLLLPQVVSSADRASKPTAARAGLRIQTKQVTGGSWQMRRGRGNEPQRRLPPPGRRVHWRGQRGRRRRRAVGGRARLSRSEAVPWEGGVWGRGGDGESVRRGVRQRGQWCRQAVGRVGACCRSNRRSLYYTS